MRRLQLLAIWYVTQWAAQGAPSKVRIVELGPGRGTLLADILRVSHSHIRRLGGSLHAVMVADPLPCCAAPAPSQTFRSLPASSSPPVTSIHLVESSPHLREVQRKKLEEAGFGGVETKWWGSVGEVPASEDEFTVVVAHEFFDAMPIHIFEVSSSLWTIQPSQ